MRALPVALASVCLALSPFAAHAASFDGDWSILAVTTKGPCDQAYRFPVKVADGTVAYAGSASTTASGRIDAAGRVKVDFVHGDQKLAASGAAKGATGSGAWQSTSCTGTWTAEKR